MAKYRSLSFCDHQNPNKPNVPNTNNNEYNIIEIVFDAEHNIEDKMQHAAVQSLQAEFRNSVVNSSSSLPGLLT